MVEEGSESAPQELRLRDLTDSYRRVLSRYRSIAALSDEAARSLRKNGDLAAMNILLGKKKLLLQDVREEEERVTGTREWWKRTRRTLPAEECRELLSLLDAIGRTLESTLDREEECRTLLRDRAVWKSPQIAGSAPIAADAPTAHAAYRVASTSARGETR